MCRNFHPLKMQLGEKDVLTLGRLILRTKWHFCLEELYSVFTTGKGQGIGKSIYVVQTLQNQIYWLKMFFFLFLRRMTYWHVTSRVHKNNYYWSTLKINQPFEPYIHHSPVPSAFCLQEVRQRIFIGTARLHQVYKHSTKQNITNTRFVVSLFYNIYW